MVNKRENLLLNKNFQSFPKLVIFPIIPIFQIGIGEGTCHPPPNYRCRFIANIYWVNLTKNKKRKEFLLNLLCSAKSVSKINLLIALLAIIFLIYIFTICRWFVCIPLSANCWIIRWFKLFLFAFINLFLKS